MRGSFPLFIGKKRGDTMGSVTAKFSRTRQSVTRALYRHDYGQTLKLEGFDVGGSVEVHYGNKGDEQTIVKFGPEDGIEIPDELLTTGKDIDAWIFMHDKEHNGETTYHVIIPVMERQMAGEDPKTQVVDYILIGGTASDIDGTGQNTIDYIFSGGDANNIAGTGVITG